MFKKHSVGLLKEGDRFKFASDVPRKVDGGGNESQDDLLQVTRTAQVNAAAGSCFFRYRPADDAAAFSHSWNGVADVQVLLESEGVEEAVVVAAVSPADEEAPAPKKRRPAVKLVKQSTIAPTKAKAGKGAAEKTKTAAKSKTGAAAKKSAVAKAEPTKTGKVVKPSKRLVLRAPTPTVSKSSAAEHSTLHEKRPSLTPQLSKPAQKKSRRA
ncbi:MAG: hypothetical protein QM775_01670 [Pirellulales bacterium]